MTIGGACYVGTTLSKQPGRRWVVVGWTTDGERAVMACLPEAPSVPYSTVRGDEARVVSAVDLQKAVEGGVLVAAGSLGAAAVSLVVRGLVGDQATSKGVRESLRRLA
jgi:hypothetical protein